LKLKLIKNSDPETPGIQVDYTVERGMAKNKENLTSIKGHFEYL
jgi:hypothetical protein